MLFVDFNEDSSINKYAMELSTNKFGFFSVANLLALIFVRSFSFLCDQIKNEMNCPVFFVPLFVSILFVIT